MKISIKDFKHAMETMGEKMDPEEINEIIADSELVDSDHIDINKFAQMIMNRI
jgi:Ca2+-binding EF-hand superfamily protein